MFLLFLAALAANPISAPILKFTPFLPDTLLFVSPVVSSPILSLPRYCVVRLAGRRLVFILRWLPVSLHPPTVLRPWSPVRLLRGSLAGRPPMVAVRPPTVVVRPPTVSIRLRRLEADDVMKHIKLTWSTLGITETFHDTLFGWVLFKQLMYL